AVGVCATTKAAVDAGVLDEQQVDQVAQKLGEMAKTQFPDLAQSLQQQDAEAGSDDTIKTDYPNCDRVLNTVQSQLEQS
ncbi:MAG: hypothetical protein AAGF24_08515, partial [Cyanobacteria bacterium P01_H01_bin.121]